MATMSSHTLMQHSHMQLPPRPALTCLQLARRCLVPRVLAQHRDPEKEESRVYRRTTFGHDEWANHRSTSRYWRHLKSGLLTSRIVRGLAGPLIYVGVISAAVSSYEQALANGMLLDIGHWHWPSLSLSIVGPFSLSTFALSLLLVFRTNSSYQRWNDARKLWGLCTNRSRDIARQALQWMPADADGPLLAAMLRWTAAFPLALMCSLREDRTLQEVMQGVLLPGELELLLAQPHPGTACLQAMGACVQACHARPIQKMRMDENITVMQDVMGGCERIFKTPIPLSYTRHTSRFLVCWLTLLPFCVADAFGWLTIPISIGLAFFLFGIEEIGVQIEEPFGILALEVFCSGIRKDINQAQALSATLHAAAESQTGSSMLAGAPLLPPPSTPSAAATAAAAATDVDHLSREFSITVLAVAGGSRSSSPSIVDLLHGAANGSSSSSSSSTGSSTGSSDPHSAVDMHHQPLRSELLRSSVLLAAAAGVPVRTELASAAAEHHCGVHCEDDSDEELYLGSKVGATPFDNQGYNF